MGLEQECNVKAVEPFLLIEELREETNSLPKLPKLLTIKNSNVFKKVFKNGIALKNKGFILLFLRYSKEQLELEQKDFLFGFILSRKIGIAVKRNYIRRKLKSAISSCLHNFHLKGYYVFIAEGRLQKLPFKDLITNINNALSTLEQVVNANENT